MGLRNIVEFIINTEYEKIPNEAIMIAKSAMIDYFGVSIGGARDPAVKILSQYIKSMSSLSEAGVIGNAFKTSTEMAAWANGAIGHVLDYDDTDSIASGYNMHHSVAIFPALLSIGERYRKSGKEIINAYIISLEVEYILGNKIGNLCSKNGWHPTAIIGVMAATVSVAKLLRLNNLKTRMALGIAASMAGGIEKNFGTMTKSLHAGNAAKNGVVAGLLAREGFTANDNIVCGDINFCRMFSGGKVLGIEDNKNDLGKLWNTIAIGIAFKPYPSCRDTHASVDATLHLKNKFNIKIEEVEGITCKIGPKQAQILKYAVPVNGAEAKFSMQYCVATALVRGRLTLNDFKDCMINDPQVRKLLPQIKVEISSSEDSTAQEVTINLINGVKYRHKVSIPLGDPKNPMPDSMFLHKFKDCTQEFITKNETENILETISNIEKNENINDLMQIVTKIKSNRNGDYNKF